MKTIKETLELALEALTETLAMTSHAEILKRKAITALREALTSVPDWASEAIEQPAQRQRSVKPLTDEEIASMMSKNLRSPEGTYFSFARDIEAAHGIKENT